MRQANKTFAIPETLALGEELWPCGNAFEHLRLTDLGMEKGQSPVNDESVDKVVAAGEQRLAG